MPPRAAWTPETSHTGDMRRLGLGAVWLKGCVCCWGLFRYSIKHQQAAAMHLKGFPQQGPASGIALLGIPQSA